MEKAGGSRQYLIIDLSQKTWEVDMIAHASYQSYVGGEGLGLYLWSKYGGGSESQDPLCIVCGALVGSTIAGTSSLSVVAKSPATGCVEASTTVSPFSIAMAGCGWQAVVLLGKSRKPIIVRIDSHMVEFCPSERLVDMSCGKTEESLSLAADEQMLCIGPAGEHKVRFASIMSEGQALDRGGFGAVLGEKQIKAVVMGRGEYVPIPAHPKAFSAQKAKLLSLLDSSFYAKSLHAQGTLPLIDRAMKYGFAAIDNVSRRTDPRLFYLGSQECMRRFSLAPVCCDCCPICCRRTVYLDTVSAPFPDFLSMMALGSNIENYDPSLVLRWYRKSLDLGLHPVSTGMVLGWVMEAHARKLISWSPALQFGKSDSVSAAIDMIAHAQGYGVDMGKGVAYLCKEYGTEDFSCQVGGKEMAPYDVRGAWGQSLCIGLGEDFPLIGESIFPALPPASEKAKGELVVWQENLLATFRSVGICPHVVLSALFKGKWRHLLLRYPRLTIPHIHVTMFANLLSYFSGSSFTEHQLMDIGRRTIALRSSLTKNTVTFPAAIPERFMIDPTSNHPSQITVPYRSLVDRYRFLRACDSARMKKE